MTGLPAWRCDEHTLARYPLWLAGHGEEAGLHFYSGHHIGAGYRREHRDLLGGQRRAVEAAALSTTGATGQGISSRSINREESCADTMVLSAIRGPAGQQSKFRVGCCVQSGKLQ